MVEQIIESKVQNRYQLFEKIDLVFLVQRGIVSVHLLDWKIFYERYLIEYKKTKSKLQSYQNVAEDFNVHVNTIRKAVKYMKS